MGAARVEKNGEDRAHCKHAGEEFLDRHFATREGSSFSFRDLLWSGLWALFTSSRRSTIELAGVWRHMTWRKGIFEMG